MKSDLEKIYSKGLAMGFGTGILFMVSGMILLILGVTGSIAISAETDTVRATITNASPGVFLSLLGAIITWRFKPKIRHEIKTEEIIPAMPTGGGGGCYKCPSCGQPIDFAGNYRIENRIYEAHHSDDGRCKRCGKKRLDHYRNHK